MGFRIHRGIFQKLNAERTAYENTFKIDDDGRIKEVDSEGNVTSGYLKIGEQASDADTVDGLHSGSFIRSDATDNVTGHTEWQDGYNIRLGNSADFRMWHDGSHTYFRNYNHGNGNIYFQGEDTAGANHALLYMFTANTRPYVSLYEDGGERFKTTSAGVEVLGEVRASNGIRLVSSGAYGLIRGYDNDNHFIVIRGSVSTGTSTLSITGGHRTTFVEHANEASEGWYFVSKASGNYTEMARIDGVGQMYIGGNKVWHAGNDGSGSGLDADTVDGYHASRLVRIDSATQRGPDFNALIPSANETFLKELHAINEGSNAPSAYTYGVLQSTKMGSMKFQWYVPHTASRGDHNTQDTIWFRTGWGASQIYDWKYLIHSGNIAGQSVNYATTAGTANAVTWANVSGKPSTFTPSSHNHSKITENSTISFGQGSLQWTDLSGNGGDGLNGNTPGNPFNDWHHHIIMNHSNSNGYYVDVAYSFHHDRVHFRRKAGSDPQSWREFWHTGNLSTTKVSNWDTAYGWGNHATQGYLDTVPEEYKTQTQNDARYAAIAHDHSGVYDPAGTAQSVSDDLEPRITAVETLASRNETGLQSKANLSGSYGQDFNVNNLRSDQWLRNTVSGKGLYNEATTQHWYSDGDDYWNIAGGGSFNAIRFRDDHGGTQRGLVGADNSNRIGFLDAGGHWAVRHNNDNGTYFYTDNETLEFRVGRDAVTGNYGTVQTETTRSSWGGYSIDGRVVFMHDHGNWWGIYNDVNNEWMIRGELNGRVELRHNSATKLETTSSGVTVTGTVTATAFAGDGSALTGISAGAPPVQATVEGGEASTLASIHFSPGEGAATFTLANGETFRLAFAR